MPNSRWTPALSVGLDMSNIVLTFSDQFLSRPLWKHDHETSLLLSRYGTWTSSISDFCLGLAPRHPSIGIMLPLAGSIRSYVVHSDFYPLDPLKHLPLSPLVHFWNRLDAHWHPRVTIPAKRGIQCQQSAALLIQLNLVESFLGIQVWKQCGSSATGSDIFN